MKRYSVPTCRSFTRNKGTILILVLAVLALLALIATTMAGMQSISRMETARYSETLEAKMLAHMGFERAIAELKRDPFFVERRTWNVDLEEATHPSYYYTESPERRRWNVDLEELKEPKLITILDSRSTPNDLRSTLNDPRSTLNDLRVGISGFGSKGTYIEGGNVYSLKVSDLQGRIYINDGINSYGGNNSSVSQNLKRLLNVLMTHPDLFGEQPKMLEKLDRFGQRLIDSRPPNGYRNVYEILRVLQREYGVEKGKEIFDKLEPHITTFAWVDNNVVNPAPLSHMVYDQYPVAYYRKGEASDVGISPAVSVQAGNKPYIDTENAPEGMTSGVMLFRRGRGKNANNEYMFSKEPLRWFDSTIGDDTHNAIYALDELFPQYIEVTSRAPVNVNTATEAVLSALLTDISGFFIMERRKYAPYSPSPKDFTVDTIAKFQDTELSHTATIRQKYQSWEYSSYSYDSKGYTMFNGTEVKEDGDEFGYLYRTLPLKGPDNQQTGTNDPRSTLYAEEIAKHLIAAREGREYNGISYSELPFTRFDKWSNMRRFFDYLVEKQIIKDTRSIYWNYLPQGWENIDSADWSTNIRYPPDLSEPTQQTYASYAIADALKANFNPNCHLNELNPDKNLYLRVDKTDLITNSTEFCFTPMGYFAVESLGRILRPVRDSRSESNSRSEYSRAAPPFGNIKNLSQKAGQVDRQDKSTNLQIYNSTSSHESTELDVFSTPVVEVSSSKVKAVVKVFDVYRETTQEQFLRGEISNKQGPEPTNSGKGLEVGPEPAISRSVSNSRSEYSRSVDSESTDLRSTLYDPRSTFNDPRSTLYDLGYDGYIQLATLGGINSQSEIRNIESTPPGVAHWPTEDIAQYEGLHVHFQFDKKAHHHASATQLGDQYRDEVSDIELTSSKIIDKTDLHETELELSKISSDLLYNNSNKGKSGGYLVRNNNTTNNGFNNNNTSRGSSGNQSTYIDNNSANRSNAARARSGRNSGGGGSQNNSSQGQGGSDNANGGTDRYGNQYGYDNGGGSPKGSSIDSDSKTPAGQRITKNDIDTYIQNRQLKFELSNYGKVEKTENYADDEKTTNREVGNRQMGNSKKNLARSFRLPGGRVVESKSSRSASNSRSEYSRAVDQQNKSTNLQLYDSTNLLSFVPSDLRIDGAYVERNAGLAYWIDEGISMFSYGGAISMWVKPSFQPGYTGKTRKLFSYDRWHSSNYTYRNPNMFSLFFVPAHSTPPLNDLRSTINAPRYVGTRVTNKENIPTEASNDGRGVKSLRPASLFAGISMTQATGSLEDWELDSYSLRSKLWEANMAHVIDIESFYNTPSLNRGSSNVERKTPNNKLEIRNSQLEMGVWSHVVWSWLIKHEVQISLIDITSGGKQYNTLNNSNNDEPQIRKSGKPNNSGGNAQGGVSFGQGPGVFQRNQPPRSNNNNNGGQNNSDPKINQMGDNNSPESQLANNQIAGGTAFYGLTPVYAYEHGNRILINGTEPEGGKKLSDISENMYSAGGRRPLFSLHSSENDPGGNWPGNSIRIGETSTHLEFQNANFEMAKSRNFSGDFTVDEFGLYGSAQPSDTARENELSAIESSLSTISSKGRYYSPGTGSSGDLIYKSGEIYIDYGRDTGRKEDYKSESDFKLLGVATTWYADKHDEKTMKPVLYNYPQSGNLSGPEEIVAEKLVETKIFIRGRQGEIKSEFYPLDLNDHTIQTTRRNNQSCAIENKDKLSYELKINLPQGVQTLLSTPVIDDITVYYTVGVEVLFITSIAP